MELAPDNALEMIRNLSRELIHADNLRDGVAAAARACLGIFNFYRLAIAFPTRKSGRFYVAAAWAKNPHEEFEGYDFAILGHPLEKTATEGSTVIRLNPQIDHDDALLTRLYISENKAEEMSVPIDLGDKRGLMIFASRKKGEFTAFAQSWAKDVGGILGLWAQAWAGPEAPHVLREQYETMLEAALDGVAVLLEGEIAYANASFREIFCISSNQEPPKDFSGLLDQKSLPYFLNALDELNKKPRILPRLEVEAKGSMGKSLHLDLGLQCILYHGEPSILVQVHNSTERAEREQEVRDSYARGDTLLHTLAHDIRAPLTTILGFSELIQQRQESLSSQEIKNMLGVVSRASKALKDLVEGLLSYSSLGSEKAPEFDIGLEPLITSMEIELEGLLHATSAKLEYRRIPPTVRGRPMELSRVFKNLIENAIKYSKTNDRPLVQISCTGEEQSFYIFCIEDNGIGIDEEKKEEIFELFNRGATGGAGVGLAIVNRIVTSHGGRIWVKNKEGRSGSKFYFTLPKPTAK